MKLFNVVNQASIPTTEVLLISPFREIWERDFSESKFYAIKEFSYIEFMCSPKKTNPFNGYSDPVERSEKIIKNLNSKVSKLSNRSKFPDKLWTPDTLVLEGIVTYKEFLYEASPSLAFLESAETALQTLKNWFNTVDLDRTNAKGALLYKPVDITNAMGKVGIMMKELNTLRDKVEQELFDTTKTLKNRVINPFEETPEQEDEEEQHNEEHSEEEAA